ncbi:GXWXG domain-containing protein [Cystobacter ferrugineus]|nr:GXWXG domain-containing protein [Cystobacter ferrugineus]
MDGLLKTFGWYGKAFVTPDDVHPLLFRRGGSVVSTACR